MSVIHWPLTMSWASKLTSSHFIAYGGGSSLQSQFLLLEWRNQFVSSLKRGRTLSLGRGFKVELGPSHLHRIFIKSNPQQWFIPPSFLVLNLPSIPQVQVRPWLIADSQYVVDHTQSLDSRKAVFVGGVPRPLKASELAVVMNEKYGNIAYVAIECDNDLKYPKG